MTIQQSIGVLTAVAAIIAGAGWVGAIIQKRMGRDVDRATAAKLQAEAKQTAQATAHSEVDTIREVLADVRADRAGLKERLDQLEARTAKLEERERHMLTRAAVHEAWDNLAFQAITQGNPGFPPPPPLRLPPELDDGKDHGGL